MVRFRLLLIGALLAGFSASAMAQSYSGGYNPPAPSIPASTPTPWGYALPAEQSAAPSGPLVGGYPAPASVGPPPPAAMPSYGGPPPQNVIGSAPPAGGYSLPTIGPAGNSGAGGFSIPPNGGQLGPALPPPLYEAASGNTSADLQRLPSLTPPAEFMPTPEPVAASALPGESIPLAEPLPLAEPAAPPGSPGYVWFDPTYWLPGPIWEGTIEIGVNGSSGNAESLNTRAGAKLSRESAASKTAASLVYHRNTNDSIESSHNALLDLHHEWFFGQSPWTLFVKFGLEYDEFKAFDLRLVLHEGVGYRWIDNPITKLTTRFGAGFSHEIGGPSDEYVPEGVFGVEYERRISDRQRLGAKVEYFPDWTNFGEYRVVTDLSWSLCIDEASNLHLKIAAIDRYDSTPNGRKPNDIDYALLLMWKL